MQTRHREMASPWGKREYTEQKHRSKKMHTHRRSGLVWQVLPLRGLQLAFHLGGAAAQHTAAGQREPGPELSLPRWAACPTETKHAQSSPNTCALHSSPKPARPINHSQQHVGHGAGPELHVLDSLHCGIGDAADGLGEHHARVCRAVQHSLHDLLLIQMGAPCSSTVRARDGVCESRMLIECWGA